MVSISLEGDSRIIYGSGILSVSHLVTLDPSEKLVLDLTCSNCLISRVKSCAVNMKCRERNANYATSNICVE